MSFCVFWSQRSSKKFLFFYPIIKWKETLRYFNYSLPVFRTFCLPSPSTNIINKFCSRSKISFPLAIRFYSCYLLCNTLCFTFHTLWFGTLYWFKWWNYGLGFKFVFFLFFILFYFINLRMLSVLMYLLFITIYYYYFYYL